MCMLSSGVNTRIPQASRRSMVALKSVWDRSTSCLPCKPTSTPTHPALPISIQAMESVVMCVDAKSTLCMLAERGIMARGVVEDPGVAVWLLDPERHAKWSLENIYQVGGPGWNNFNNYCVSKVPQITWQERM